MGVLAAPQKHLALESPSSDSWVLSFTFAVARTVRAWTKLHCCFHPHSEFCFVLLGIVFCLDFDPFFSLDGCFSFIN
jgi:hypothetical protein